MVSYGSTGTVQRDTSTSNIGGTERSSLLQRHGHSHATPGATPAATPPPASPGLMAGTQTPSSCSAASTITATSTPGDHDRKLPLFNTTSAHAHLDLVEVPDFAPEPKPASLHSYLAETLQAPYTTPFLLTITFSTAILDSMTYNRFATFASNQTGNTVFLALAAVHAGQRKLKLTVTSFAGFVGSGLLFGQIGAYFGHRRRAWVLSSLVFQIIVLAIFTILAAPNAHPELGKNGRYEWCLMLLAAVQSGPQVTMGTNIDSLMPTAMLTSPIAGLLSDPDLFALRRAPNRDKRLVYILTFIVGAHVGLASDVFFSPWTTAILALFLKAIAFVIAVKIPGTRTSVLKRQAELEAQAAAQAANQNQSQNQITRG